MSNLQVAQAKMKSRFDKKSVMRAFQPDDRVLILLPIPATSLQARYSGPYIVKKKINDCDYLVSTPERRRGSRLCNINMLKPYVKRGDMVEKPLCCVSETAKTAEVEEELSGA